MEDPEEEEGVETWCQACKRYWTIRPGSLGASSDIVYTAESRYPYEAPPRCQICYRCVPKVYAL